MTREEAIEILNEIIDEGWLISDFDKCTAIDACEMAIKALEQEPTTKNDLGVDCISRADAIGSIAVECSAEKLDIDYSKFLMLRRAIKALPSVTPQEPKTGHWYIDERPESDREVICSNCEQPVFKYHKLDFDYRPKFCPNCGADMREVEE